MTMQTNTLPFQVSGANALAAPQRNAAAGVQAKDGGQFGATLSREIAQRQAAGSAPAPAPAAASSGKPAAPARQQGADKPAAQGPKAAAREQVKQNDTAPDAPATAQQSAAAGSAEAQDAATAAESAAAAAAAEAAAPVTDMLAFMASLAQPVAAVATPLAAQAGAAGADLQLAALQSAFSKLETAAGTTVAADPALATAIEGGEAGFSLAAGVQPAAADTADTADLAAPQQAAQAAVPLDANKLQGQARELAPQVEAIEAPTPAVTQLQAAAAKLDSINPAAVPADRIPARMGTQAWDNQVSQRIVYMVGKEQAATLTLNPPDLGPVQVVLSVNNEGASIAFSSNQQEVRQALENALPRLREMMSENGIALGNATVDAGTQGQRQAQDGERRNEHGNGGAGFGNGPAVAANDGAARPATRTVILGDSGMVDTFA